MIDCEFKLNLGNGEKHSRFSTVSPCSYSFIIDKNLALEILEKKLLNQILHFKNLNLKLKINQFLIL